MHEDSQENWYYNPIPDEDWDDCDDCDYDWDPWVDED